MRRTCLALVLVALAAAAWATAAWADSYPAPAPAPAMQTAGQIATNNQTATAAASSTQIAPQNTNVNVRVLSPGTNGPVSQTNASTALGLAGNANLTGQGIAQSGAGQQQAAQAAGSSQDAAAAAESTQVKPENTNVDVRVLSDGADGPVSQANTSTAAAIAANLNATDQQVAQDPTSPAGQTAGQEATNEQAAVAAAESKQIAPQNTNVGVRVLSPGDDGSVTQRNDSTAAAIALNGNKTKQDIDQQAGHGSPSQTAAQIAGNTQNAGAWAESEQIHPSNTNVGVRVLGPGHNGDVTQANTSNALGVALNGNHTEQSIEQGQSSAAPYPCCGERHDDGVAVQAAGQLAGNVQSAVVCCASSVQVAPENTNISGGDGSVHQDNTSNALGVAANLNGLEQEIGQGPEAKSATPWAQEAVDPASRDADPASTSAARMLGEPAPAPAEALAPKPKPEGVNQSNNSNAVSLAANGNHTSQSITQALDGPPAGVTVQAAGQAAANEQHASSTASSFQLAPRNVNGSTGVLDTRCNEHRTPWPSERCGKPAPQPCDPCGKPAPPPCDPCGKPAPKPRDPCEKAAPKPRDPCEKPAPKPRDPCEKAAPCPPVRCEPPRPVCPPCEKWGHGVEVR